jgi:insertion element IS1 protein InsB
VENPVWKPISAETKARIDKVLLERVSLAGIVQVAGVSAQWLQDSVNAKYAAQPQVADISVQKPSGQ